MSADNRAGNYAGSGPFPRPAATTPGSASANDVPATHPNPWPPNPMPMPQAPGISPNLRNEIQGFEGRQRISHTASQGRIQQHQHQQAMISPGFRHELQGYGSSPFAPIPNQISLEQGMQRQQISIEMRQEVQAGLQLQAQAQAQASIPASQPQALSGQGMQRQVMDTNAQRDYLHWLQHRQQQLLWRGQLQMREAQRSRQLQSTVQMPPTVQAAPISPQFRERLQQDRAVMAAKRKPAASLEATHAKLRPEKSLRSPEYPKSTPPMGNSRYGNISETYYQYDPLVNQRDIRLLRILPGKETDTLECELCQTSIDTAVEYSALSYAWGDRTLSATILCNGRWLKVTDSLYGALQRIRDGVNPRLVWADAVCINQEDVAERGRQVRLMRYIYRKSKTVLIWLGNDGAEQAPSVFALARMIHDTKRAPDADDSAWKMFSALYERAWFWRLWCVQEISLANMAEVLWGPAAISWATLGFAIAWVRTVGYQVMRRTPLNGIYNAYLMYTMSTSNKHPEPVSFLHLMTLTRQFQTSDMRDRVYGLLGLPTTDSDPERGDLFLEPDYSKSAPQIFEELARKCLSLPSEGLRALSAVQHGPEIEEELPSWVPQWNRLYTQTLAPANRSVRSHSTSVGLPASPPEFSGPLLLGVSGLELDTVATVSDTFPASSGFALQAPGFEWIWASAVAPLETYPDGCSSLAAAFCWTVTAGKDWYGVLVEDAPSHLADFREFQRQNFFCPISGPGEALSEEYAETGDADRFVQAMSNACSWRRFFVTAKGFVGIGPPCLRQEDVVVVLSGGIVPFLLRKRGEEYKLVGEAYVHGIMNGEACKEPLRGGAEVRTFWLS